MSIAVGDMRQQFINAISNENFFESVFFRIFEIFAHFLQNLKTTHFSIIRHPFDRFLDSFIAVCTKNHTDFRQRVIRPDSYFSDQLSKSSGKNENLTLEMINRRNRKIMFERKNRKKKLWRDDDFLLDKR